jgi:hypothetical protein
MRKVALTASSGQCGRRARGRHPRAVPRRRRASRRAHRWRRPSGRRRPARRSWCAGAPRNPRSRASNTYSNYRRAGLTAGALSERSGMRGTRGGRRCQPYVGRHIPGVDNLPGLERFSPARKIFYAHPAKNVPAGSRPIARSCAATSTRPSPGCAQRLRRVCTCCPHACAQYESTSSATRWRLSEPFDRTGVDPRDWRAKMAASRGEVRQ